jgi:phosphotransferase system HPr (HPr) family protein
VSASSEPGEFAEEVRLTADLHARPAGALARTAARHAARVELVVADRVARASSVLEIMALGARAGTTVTLRAQGPGASEAVAELAAFLRTEQNA